MAVTSVHVSGSLRLVDHESETISSYHQIRPNVTRENVEDLLAGVLMLRGEHAGNAFFTRTTALEDASA
jgi:hypothetical protein